MKLFYLLRSIIAFVLLIAVVIFLTSFSDPVKQKVFSTLHISQNVLSKSVSLKSKNLNSKFSKDISNQLEGAKTQVMQFKPNDLVSFLQRAQKIQKDVQGLQTSLNDQLNNATKKK